MFLIKNVNICKMPQGTSCDILIRDGKVIEISETIHEAKGMKVLDAHGLVAAPGLVDMHVHFRDPGFEHKEDILTGAAAAAAGGVTTCCCMPNTSPVADCAEVISYIIDKARKAPVKVLPVGAVTLGQKGKELTDFAALKAAGAIALSDDGNPVQNAGLAREAMRRAHEHDLLIISHCEDSDMVRDYGVNEGAVSRELGIPGRPAVAEEIMVARDVMLASETGARVHIAHISTAGSVEIIRQAKKAGVRVTAETCPQYFTLTEAEALRQGSLARVNPPLRTKADVEAITEGLVDGTIDVIATDHAPHTADDKALPLAAAASGMVGLETSLALSLTFLYHAGRLGLSETLELLSDRPSRILRLCGASERGLAERFRCSVFNNKQKVDSNGALYEAMGPALSEESLCGGTVPAFNGAHPGKEKEFACRCDADELSCGAADFVIFDPDEEWTVDPACFNSKARNTPFGGMRLRGKVKYTISRGNIVYGGIR